MPHFDATITLGSLLTVASVIVTAIVFFVRMSEVQRSQAKIIDNMRGEFHVHEAKDDMRFDKLENRIIDLVKGLERLVGQSDFRMRPRGRNQ